MKINMRPIVMPLACIVLLAALCRYFVATLRIYIDLWSFCMVVGGTSLFLIISFSMKEILQAFKFVLMPSDDDSEEKYLHPDSFPIILKLRKKMSDQEVGDEKKFADVGLLLRVADGICGLRPENGNSPGSGC